MSVNDAQSMTIPDHIFYFDIGHVQIHLMDNLPDGHVDEIDRLPHLHNLLECEDNPWIGKQVKEIITSVFLDLDTITMFDIPFSIVWKLEEGICIVQPSKIDRARKKRNNNRSIHNLMMELFVFCGIDLFNVFHLADPQDKSTGRFG